MASLLSVDNILIFGVVGAAGAYFLVPDFKQWVDDQIAGLGLGGSGNGNGDGTGDGDGTGNGDGTGDGVACDDPSCTSPCCKCKCKDRAACPESGTCCDKCGAECPAQCAGQQQSALLPYFPDEFPISLPDYYSAGSLF